MALTNRERSLLKLRFRRALYANYGAAEFDTATAALTDEKKLEITRAIIENNDLKTFVVEYKKAFNDMAEPIAEQQVLDAIAAGTVPITVAVDTTAE